MMIEPSLSNFVLRPLPENRDITGWKEVPIIESNEPLVSLQEYNFIIKPMYYLQNIVGSTSECLARVSVAKLLVNARSMLPPNYNFVIWDAYRPLQVQRSLFDDYKAKLRSQHPYFTEDELFIETQKYVSLPSQEPSRPSPHNTGGAVDLTLDSNGLELNMGTEFDHFGPEATPDYFESATDEIGIQIRNNRRILYWVLTSVGFKSYPFEWWHWSYGDQMACVDDNKTAIYGGLFTR